MSALAFPTPVFDSGDPIICRELAMRPALWQVVFTLLQHLGEDWSWRQVDINAETPETVAAEMQKVTDSAVARNCVMIGQILELAIANPPSWLLRCDGAQYAIADYPELAAVINAGFVVSGTHFRVPDRDQRIGLDGVLTASQGGENTHVLTLGEMPAHTHSYEKITPTLIDAGVTPTVIGIDDINTGDTGSSGGGAAHNNMQAYEGTQFYIVARLP